MIYFRDVVLTAILTFLFGIVIGLVILRCEIGREVNHIAIQTEQAYYHPTTGKITWKDSTCALYKVNHDNKR